MDPPCARRVGCCDRGVVAAVVAVLTAVSAVVSAVTVLGIVVSAVTVLGIVVFAVTVFGIARSACMQPAVVSWIMVNALLTKTALLVFPAPGKVAAGSVRTGYASFRP